MIAQHLMRLEAIHDQTGRLTIETGTGATVALSAEQLHRDDARTLFRLFSLSPSMWFTLHIAKDAMAHAAGALLDNPDRPDGSYAHLMQAKEHVERILAEAGGEAPASAHLDIRDSLAIVAGEIVYGDGTDASHQRAIDYSVAALKAHGIDREAWARALAGDPPKADPLHAAAPELLRLVKRLRETAEYLARMRRNLGDDEGARLNELFIALEIDPAIAAAEGRTTDAPAPTSEDKPRFVIVIDNGCITDVVSDDPAIIGMPYATLDHDTDGMCSGDELVLVPQADGDPREGYISENVVTRAEFPIGPASIYEPAPSFDDEEG